MNTRRARRVSPAFLASREAAVEWVGETGRGAISTGGRVWGFGYPRLKSHVMSFARANRLRQTTSPDFPFLAK